MDYKKFLEEEYKANNKKPTYCMLGQENLIVPFSYDGDKDAFLDDLLSFQDGYNKEYEEFNKNNPDRENLEPATIDAGDALIAVPLKLAEKKYKKECIVKEITQKAIRQLRRAVRKTADAKKQFPNEEFNTTLDSKQLKKLSFRIKAEKVKKAAIFVAKAIKLAAKEGANVAAGTVGAVPALAYHFLNKKYKFAKNNAHSFVQDKALPYIKKGFIKAFATTIIVGGGKIAYDNQYSSDKDDKDKIETVDTSNLNDVQKHNLKVFNNNINEMKVFLTFVENCATKPYFDGAGVRTIGYGCTAMIDDAGNGGDRDKAGVFTIKANQTMTMEEADVQKTRYLKKKTENAILKHVKVPLSDEEVVACAVFSYCLGESRLHNSDFAKALNKGIKGEELANYLGGFREQKGVPKRLYYAALYLTGKINAKDMLNFNTETCYFHDDDLSTICQFKNNKIIKEHGHIKFKYDKASVEYAKEITKRNRNSPKILNPQGNHKCLPVRDLLLPEVVKSVERGNKKDICFLDYFKKSERS
ncbi:MAG: hypothetical protein R3Y43_05215 [Alphaproteobacteria bacterium]